MELGIDDGLPPEGELVGNAEGSSEIVGLELGCKLGDMDTDGEDEGASVGSKERVGDSLGMFEGSKDTDGDADGPPPDGWALGEDDG